MDGRGSLSQQQIEALALRLPGGADNIQDIYPLSSLQEGMLFHRLLDQQGDSYILSLLFELKDSAHLEPFVDALETVISRHDTLRTAILWEHLPEPVQVVYRKAKLPVERVQLDRNRDTVEQLTEMLQPQRHRLDLSKAPLMRLQVADGEGRTGFALLQVHHIVCDHQSLQLVADEALLVLQSREQDLPAAVPYRNHVAEVRKGDQELEALAYFRTQLGDVTETTAPFLLSESHGDDVRIVELRQELDPELALRIRSEAQRHGTSAARLFHAAWGLVVARTSGKDDVVYGTVLLPPAHKRTAGRMLGMTVNTLPLRLQLSGISAEQLVEQTHRQLLGLTRHQQTSLALAQRCSGIDGTAQLFTTLLNYRRNARSSSATAEPQDIRVIARGEAWTAYPISVTVDDIDDGFRLIIQTDCRVDPKRIAGYLHTSMHSLLDALAQAPHTPALALQILPQAERRQLLESFNAPIIASERLDAIHEAFDAQASRTPNAPALVFGDHQLTFAKVKAKVDRLASYLRAQGLQPEERVGICVERSVEMIVGVLAILKAGGAYVPLDPDYPPDRLAHILRDATPKLLLTQARLLARLPEFTRPIISLDQDIEEQAFPAKADSHSSPDSLAYVIYTSGSTGQPKGVMIQHRHVMNLQRGLEDLYRDRRSVERVALNASLNFDASVQQWVHLLSGRALYIVPQDIRSDPEKLRSFLAGHRIEAIDCTPSQLKTWLGAGWFDAGTSPLRLVLVGGEAIEPELWKTLARHASVSFCNVYGPTECTVDATATHITIDAGLPHIGKPMRNRRAYVLDHDLTPAPIGVAGEIHIAGEGIARGYLDRPTQTAERFLPDPFATDAHARMYRTGDLGRWREDGSLEYLGRNDHQVKIRGFRIELGDIESQLVRHNSIKAAVVLAREDTPGDKRLVAYVVPREGLIELNIETLRSHVGALLPDYMIPSAFVTLPQLPLTPSGKLDRKALPVPNLRAYTSKDYEPPQGDVEEILSGIWQKLLRVERVGRTDNFFELGGHSLLIVHMLEQLRRLGLATEVRRVFKNPILKDLAHALTSGTSTDIEVPLNLIPEGSTEITPQMLSLIDLDPVSIDRVVQSVPGGAANVQDIYPLTPLQEGILFHYLTNEGNGDPYAVPIALHVRSRQRLDELIAAIQAVIDRHDVLRTAVLWENLPRPLQVVYRRAELSVEQLEPQGDVDALEQVRKWAQPDQQILNLQQAPLIRLTTTPDTHGEGWYALLRLHHIVTDNTSQDILISEILATLEGGQPPAAQSVPYRTHVARSQIRSGEHEIEAFFRSKLSDVDEPTAPFGLADVHGGGVSFDEGSRPLDPGIAERIRVQARHVGVTTAALFHAAWALVVARTTGRDDVVFGTVLSGRLQGVAGSDRTVGMFINTLPIRLRLSDLSARELIEHTQRELVELLSYEQASLATAQRCSGITGSASLFSALLNFRHSSERSASKWSRASGLQLLFSRNWTNYPLTLSIDDVNGQFDLEAQTDSRINPQLLLDCLQATLQSLLEALEQDSHQPALLLSALSANERHRVLESFNATRAPHPRIQPIHELFQAQVRETPHAVAVEHGHRALTYTELNNRANQLAAQLSKEGVGPGNLVGVCLERGVEMVAAVFGILKVGAACVPLDPNYPADRLQYMLSDADPPLVITQKSVRALFPDIRAKLLVLDAQEADASDHPDMASEAHEAAADSLVYVIFTSGSTGRPKGTALPHRALHNLVEWHRRNFHGTRRVLQFAALSFDVAFQEIFSTLCTGGTLVLLDEWIRKDAQAFAELLSMQRIERLFVPPLMLQSLAEHCANANEYPEPLKEVITAGEQLLISPEITQFFRRLTGCRLANHYGPTETHVVTTLLLNGAVDQWPHRPCIGRPIANTRIYVLDERLQPVPTGVRGEIYIAGSNVGRGYLNRAALTAQRFVADPFSPEPKGRMYRTGDVGLWRDDGTVEYLGRNDEQVKIRGFRIELAEIEAQLGSLPTISKAAVIAREDRPGDKRLVAYVCYRDPTQTGTEPLRAHLKAVLPEHMVPSAFVVLDVLPVTPSGKLNRRALPAPDYRDYANKEFEAPQGDLETSVANIWQHLLRVERVGRTDNFFELGGHSLHAMRLAGEVQTQLNVRLRALAVFQHPTVRALADHIRSLQFSSTPSQHTRVREIVFDEE